MEQNQLDQRVDEWLINEWLANCTINQQDVWKGFVQDKHTVIMRALAYAQRDLRFAHILDVYIRVDDLTDRCEESIIDRLLDLNGWEHYFTYE